MREIKFRAFSAATKTMIDLKKITPLALSEGTGEGIFIPFKEGIIIMQYTGLKDKNGKEIYEGDILKREGVVSFVVWMLDKWRFNSYMVVGMDLYKNVDTTRSADFEIAEIIGNIYENPELIK